MAQRLQPEIVSCGVSRGTRGVPCGVAWESAVRCAVADARVAPQGAVGVLRGARGAAGCRGSRRCRGASEIRPLRVVAGFCS